MEKMRMETLDMVSENIKKIENLFPNCITETVDENGNPKKAINFELLRQMLSDDVIEGNEAYEFTWVGKKAAIVEANKPIRKTLRPCPEESVDWGKTENLYIEGDNLEVLKLLQESYLGKVKMIYIDPPYNTGHDFVYPDSYIMDNDEYDEGTGYFDEDGKVNFSRENYVTAGKYHSDWCSMLYSRLLLARNLLQDDGLIFISIDDHEVDNLRKICNEIFGETRFINCIAVNMNSLSGVKMTHAIKGKRYPAQKEYILIYKKSDAETHLVIEKVHKNQWDKEYNLIIPEMQEGQFESFQTLTEKEVNSQLAKMHLESLKAFADANNIDLTEEWKWSNAYRIFGTKSNRPLARRLADISFNQQVVGYLNEDNNMRFFRSDYNKDTRDPRIELVQAEANSSVFLSDNWIDISNDGGIAQEGGVIFPNGKKPLALIERVIKATGCKDNDIVLDFFSGSATTAHAVMQLNLEDGIKRRYIMIQVAEPCEANSEELRRGCKTICDIGKKRIIFSGTKIKEENPLTTKDLDVGFRVFKLDDSNMNDVYYSANEYKQDMLSLMESNVKEDRTDLDLLFGCLLEWGLPLSLPYTSEMIENCTVHTYNDGDLIACFDENVPDVVIKKIAKRKPLRAVFRDSSFESSPSKINLTEIFKMLAPDTRVKVI